MSSTWFDDVPVLGALPADRAAAKLRELGEDELADEVDRQPGGATFGFPFGRGGEPKLWQHTAHTFGYVAPSGSAGAGRLPVIPASTVAADESLKGAPLKITLDRMRVADYPGGGIHRVLLDFYAQHQVAGAVEHLHFNVTFRAHEGESAAVLGYPIFVGLTASSEGVAFKCFTVNVSNDDDEAFLGLLESDAFRSGLRLTSTLQPAIAPLSELAAELTKSIAKRHQNVAVQDFYLGLDFSDIALRARLAQGSYVAVQIPETLVEPIWTWDDWVYSTTTGQFETPDGSQRLPYNYLVFSVSRYEA